MVESQEMSLNQSLHHNSQKVVQRGHNHKTLEDQFLKAQANLALKLALREEANQRVQIDLHHQHQAQKDHSHQPQAQIDQPQLVLIDQLLLVQTDLLQQDQTDQPRLAQRGPSHQFPIDHNRQLVLREDLNQRVLTDLHLKAQVAEDDLSLQKDLHLHKLKGRTHKAPNNKKLVQDKVLSQISPVSRD
jgi:hypothetical protein